MPLTEVTEDMEELRRFSSVSPVNSVRDSVWIAGRMHNESAEMRLKAVSIRRELAAADVGVRLVLLAHVAEALALVGDGARGGVELQAVHEPAVVDVPLCADLVRTLQQGGDRMGPEHDHRRAV